MVSEWIGSGASLVVSATVRITAEQAADGRQSLKFSDSADTRGHYFPYICYHPRFREGSIHVGLDLWVQPGAMPTISWRKSEPEIAAAGPQVSVDAAGRLMVSGKQLIDIPPETWFHLEMVCAVGNKANGTWTLKVRLPKKDAFVFHDLPCSPSFKEFGWLGITGSAKNATTFYLDNLNCERCPLRRNPCGLLRAAPEAQ